MSDIYIFLLVRKNTFYTVHVYNQWIRNFFVKWYLANSIFIALYYNRLIFCMDRNSKTLIRKQLTWPYNRFWQLGYFLSTRKFHGLYQSYKKPLDIIIFKKFTYKSKQYLNIINESELFKKISQWISEKLCARNNITSNI